MRHVDCSTPAVVLEFHHGSLGIARTLGRWGVPVYGVDADSRALGFASRYCRDAFVWDLQEQSGERSVDFLLSCARRFERRALLIPTSDTSAMFVADHAEALADAYIFPAQSPALIRSLSNKRDLHFLAKKLGIPTPAASFPESADDIAELSEGDEFPLVLRGIDGSPVEAGTGKRIVIVRSGAELLERYAALSDADRKNLMLQEYIPGGDDTIWMFNGYFDDHSECLAAFTGRKLRQHPVHTGATSLGICEWNEEAARQTIHFMKAIGYRGILDIGFRHDARDGQYKLLDPNPRIGSTFRLFVARNGMDVARVLYLDMTGQSVPEIVAREGRKWLVEDRDLESCLDYRREGTLTLRGWVRSLRGVEETAWFAADDLRPFIRMCWSVLRRALRWVVKRSLAPGRTASAPAAVKPSIVHRRLKSVLGAWMYRTELYRVLFRQRAVIVVFHRVNDTMEGDPLTCSSVQFDRFCRFFKRYFRVVSLRDLLDRLDRGEDVSRCLVITFDDGYLDNHDIAAPHLERLRLPACFFVSTQLIESTTVPRWDARNGVQSEWMTWEDIRSLHHRGFEIGAHTERHVDLGVVHGEEACREIRGSKTRLERELRSSIRYFSYPFGGRSQMTEANRQVARDAGFDCCLSAYGGTVRVDSDPFNLKRIPVTPWHLTPAQYALELLLHD